jgi:UDP-N-acetylmuramoyl-tripeptide--D-alanyl-D-alanine ligase
VEMGTNQLGEIAALAAIVEPDIVVVTSIAEEHLEGLGDLASAMREELAACDRAKVTIVPASQPEIAAALAARARRIVAAGLDAGDVRAERWTIGGDGLGAIVLDGVEVRCPARGAHNLRNAMLALAAARECGVSTADAARGLAGARPPAMRVSWEQIGRVTLINDAYNSNPESVRAALDLLALAGAGRQRVAILGTMLELGLHAERLHDEVARTALASPIELLVGVGEFAPAFARAGTGGSRVLTAPDVGSVWVGVSSRLQPDAVILLKGSRGVRLERLVPYITEWASSVE